MSTIALFGLILFSWTIYNFLVHKKEVVVDQQVAWLNCEFVSKGPISYLKELPPPHDGYIGLRYRVGVLVDEIYTSFSIERIRHDDSMEGKEYIDALLVLNSFEMAERLDISYEQTSGLEFVKWENWNSFLISLYGKNLAKIHILSDYNNNKKIMINIRKLKS